MSYFLGVDIGTYSSKGVLVRDDGTVVASHAVPHALAMPQPGWYEHDAEATWWHDFVAITRAVLAQSGIPATGIAAIGVSSISPAIVPVDADGNALRPAILYGIDTRATQEIAAIEQALGGGDAFFRRYAMTLSAQSAAPKIRWIRTHEPEIWRATRLVLGGAGYIVWRLTGSATIDHYDAGAYAPLYDPATLAWDPAFADLVAPVEWMAQPTWTCAIAGRVHAAAAAVTGLAVGTPVITGTADAAAEAVSAGLAETGDMMIMVGSTVFFIVRTEQQSASRRFWGGRFLEPGSFAPAASSRPTRRSMRAMNRTTGSIAISTARVRRPCTRSVACKRAPAIPECRAAVIPRIPHILSPLLENPYWISSRSLLVSITIRTRIATKLHADPIQILTGSRRNPVRISDKPQAMSHRARNDTSGSQAAEPRCPRQERGDRAGLIVEALRRQPRNYNFL